MVMVMVMVQNQNAPNSNRPPVLRWTTCETPCERTYEFTCEKMCDTMFDIVPQLALVHRGPYFAL